MSKIEFFALGGLDEKEKPCYVLNINGDVFVLNCGIAIPPSIKLGVKKIIPDFNWLINNKQSIKGIFIGMPSYHNFGGLEFLHQFIPNVPIYTNKIGAIILETYFIKRAERHKHKVIKLNLKVMEPLKVEKIGSTNVKPFRVSSSIPCALGFSFMTTDGAVTYIDDFIINPTMVDAFQSQLTSNITEGNSLLTILGCGMVSDSEGFTSPHHRANTFFENIIADDQKRIIVTCYDDDIYKIYTLSRIATAANRPFAIFSKTFGEVFTEAQKTISKKQVINLPVEEINTTENGIVVITGTPQRLFTKMEKIISGEDTRITFKPTDTFVFASNTVPGYETLEAKMFDDVTRCDLANVHKLPRNNLPVKASVEDIRYLVCVLKTKNIIPVSGLYMDLINFKRVISALSAVDGNFVNILRNGEVLTITNGAVEQQRRVLKLEQQLIGTQGVVDVGASSLFERDQMEENGCVLVSVLINQTTKRIEKHNFDAVGVVNLTDSNKEIVNGIVEETIKSVEKFLSENEKNNAPIDVKSLKNIVKKIVEKQFDKKFNKKPLVLTTIVFNKNKG